MSVSLTVCAQHSNSNLIHGRSFRRTDSIRFDSCSVPCAIAYTPCVSCVLVVSLVSQLHSNRPIPLMFVYHTQASQGALWAASAALLAFGLASCRAQTVTESQQLPDCEIPNETKRGICLPVNRCTAYLQVRNVTNLSSERVNFLKKVQCVAHVAHDQEQSRATPNADELYQPLVCCPANGQDYLYPVIQFSKFEYRRFLDVTARFKRKKLKRRIQTVEPSTGFNLLNECGKQVTNRIYGGEIAELDEYPWLALLVYHSSKFASSSRAFHALSKLFFTSYSC